MTTLHPDLLRACAAYLAHADAYCLDSAGQMSLLRSTAGRAIDRNLRDADIDALFDDSVPPPVAAKECDELTRAHIEAIRAHGRAVRVKSEVRVRTSDVAHAIRDATPAMLAWWCERLAR